MVLNRYIFWLLLFTDAGKQEYQLVTSQGPATSMVFALKLIELLKGKDEATKVKDGLLV
jgi:putative intracellular protease/amidase